MDTINNVHISDLVILFFADNISDNAIGINNTIKKISGINNFFDSTDAYIEFMSQLVDYEYVQSSTKRHEYGDYQTNIQLSNNVINYVSSSYKLDTIEFLFEPTCGHGNFIISSLPHLNSLKKIVGVEIYESYALQCKLNILDYYLTNQVENVPCIDIICEDIFKFDIDNLAKNTHQYRTLIVGNPP